jgi:TrmH family RNA methyltransferase
MVAPERSVSESKAAQLEQSLAGALERIRRCATARGREQQGQYLIEGERLIARALRAQTQLALVLCGKEFLRGQEAQRLVSMLSAAGVEYLAVPDKVLVDLADGRSSGLCVGLSALAPEQSLRECLGQMSTEERRLLLIAVDVDEPGNVGALTRTALASGVDALVCVGSTDLFHPKAVRSSMGSVFKVRHCRASDAQECVGLLRQAGFMQVAAVAQGGASLFVAQLSSPRAALYVGNEARGLPQAISSQVDGQVTIPMPAGVDSFSINAATAVVLYELQRQRGAFS